MYEEVNMPPTEQAPVTVGQNRVAISSLDEVIIIPYLLVIAQLVKAWTCNL